MTSAPVTLRPRAQTLVGMSAPAVLTASPMGSRSSAAAAVTMTPAPIGPHASLAPAARVDLPATAGPRPVASLPPNPVEERPEPNGSLNGADLHPTPFEPRGPSKALYVAGALVWIAVFAAGVLPMTLGRSPEPQARGTLSAMASLPTPTSATALAPVAPPPPAPGPTAVPPSALSATVAPAPAVPFSAPAAKRALDRTWREVGKCRRGKKFGNATATITFAADGTVDHVDVGSPFAGTPTGDCAIAALTAAHVAPFRDASNADPTAVLVYRFYVAPR
jgi:hypothetical protein